MGGLRTEARTVGDLTVTTTQLPPLRSCVLLHRLGRHVVPAMAKLEGVSIASLLRADLDSFGPALSQLFTSLSEAEFLSLMRETLVATSVQAPGEKSIELMNDGAIDRAFAGRLPALFGVLRFALEVNFAGFFGNASDASKAPGATDAPAPTPATASR